MDNHMVLARKLDGARLQHAGTGRGELQHILVRSTWSSFFARGATRGSAV